MQTESTIEPKNMGMRIDVLRNADTGKPDFDYKGHAAIAVGGIDNGSADPFASVIEFDNEAGGDVIYLYPAYSDDRAELHRIVDAYCDYVINRVVIDEHSTPVNPRSLTQTELQAIANNEAVQRAAYAWAWHTKNSASAETLPSHASDIAIFAAVNKLLGFCRVTTAALASFDNNDSDVTAVVYIAFDDTNQSVRLDLFGAGEYCITCTSDD